MRSIIICCLLLILTMAACAGQEPEVVEPTATPTVEAVASPAQAEREAEEPAPVATDTVAPTEIPEPTATPESLPTPTALPISLLATPTPAPTLAADPCEQELSGQDALLAQQFPALGCPQGPASFAYMAHQPFQRGQMIWREDNATIYVLDEDGTWQGLEDTFTEDQPESDPTLAAPENLFQPVRGFGRIWREVLGGPDSSIGWATMPEQGTNANVQEWEHGLFFSFSLAERYVLFDDGRWEQVE